MARRVKSDLKLDSMGVCDLASADATLRQIGDLQMEIHDLEVICKESVDAAKEALQQAAAPLHAAIARKTEALQIFAETHRDSVFGKNKSVKLQHGQMGWRLSTLTTIGKNTLALIKKKLRDRADQLVRIKETVDKKALKALSGKELMEIEVFTTTTNDFFAEPDVPAAVDYGTQGDNDSQ